MAVDIERSKWPSTANIFVALGMVALAASFFMPSLAADRIARIEGRAMAAARALRDLALSMEPFDEFLEESQEALLAGFRDACKELGQPPSTWPELDSKPSVVVDAPSPPLAVYMNTNHYRFMLCREPVNELVFQEERRALEVYAWPHDELGAARTAFYFPEAGIPAFSRNLVARYRGTERSPDPGAARPRSGGSNRDVRLDREGGYVGAEYDERWLVLEDQPPK
ncbi:MAG: hypothetical protein ACYTG5_16300 [Planctomycetota bacterium]|jgi:hypothetical protein